MKREYKEEKPKYKYLYSHFPIFIWKECFLCNREFIREWGWKVYTCPVISRNHDKVSMYTTRFVCNECGKTKESISDILLKHKFGII